MFFKDLVEFKAFKQSTVSLDDWNILNEIEIKNGQEVGKPREKLVNVDEMLGYVNKFK